MLEAEDELERLARKQQDDRRKQNEPPPPLPFIDMSTWDSVEPTPRQWLIVDYIPSRQVTLLSGTGGIGKSVLALQLLAASALRREWFGTLFPKHGAGIYLGAEDEQDEIHRRLAAILDYYGGSFAKLTANGFRALAFAGKDAVLALFDKSGRIKETPLFESLYAEAVKLQPSTIVIDTAADTFLGDEIKRDQVRQFCSLLRRLAIDSNAAVILNTHPSLTGMKSGSGLSGSTHWHNSVRARAYFRRPKDADEGEETDNEQQPDDGRRELHFLKNQYGPLARCVELRWRDGLWLPPAASSKAEDKSEREQKADDLFLTMLRRFDREGRNVSASTCPTYAPTVFAREPAAKDSKTSKNAFADAMARLFEAKRIRVVTDGPASRQRSRIVEVPPSNGGFQQPSNGLPTPSNTLSTHTPHTPHPVGRGTGGVGSPAPPNGGCATEQDGKSEGESDDQ
jgi:RecA-family ATPase